MANMQPIKIYLQAVEAYKKGDQAKAAQLLAESLGAIEPSNTIKNSLGLFFDTQTLANDAVLKILATEVTKS